MNVGSLFSGIGGIEIGFEKYGFKTEWFVENDAYAQAILRKRFPNANIYGDITQIDFRTIPKVDILTGGFPCQDISNAGKRAGISGSRSSLWKYYCEAIRVLRPKYALIENVSALANRGLDVVLADLAKIGYDAEWYNLSASAVGAMHRRERLFIIAYDMQLRRMDGQSKIESMEWEQAQHEVDSSDKDASNSYSIRHSYTSKRSEGGGNERIEIKGECPNVSNANNNNNREQRKKGIPQENWRAYPKIESTIRGMDDGIPNWAHRIRCLGNAVVPQSAEVFAQAIKERIQKTIPSIEKERTGE